MRKEVLKRDLTFLDLKKISDILELALDDLQFIYNHKYKAYKGFEDVYIKLDMRQWVRPYRSDIVVEGSKKRFCSVGLAGCVMVRRILNANDIGLIRFQHSDFECTGPYGSKIRDFLRCINEIRVGRFLDALTSIGYTKLKDNWLDLEMKLESLERNTLYEMIWYPEDHLKEWEDTVKYLRKLGV